MDAVDVGRLATEWDGLEVSYYLLHDKAVRWAVRITRNHDAAEDVVQEAFLRVFGRVRPLRDEQAVEFYLRRAVINTALSRARSERRQEAREARSSSAPPVPTDDEGELWERVRRLPRRQFTVVALRYWLDLSEQETARLMRCRVGTVKSLASRALGALRTELTDD